MSTIDSLIHVPQLPTANINQANGGSLFHARTEPLTVLVYH